MVVMLLCVCGGSDRAREITSRQPEWSSVTLGTLRCAGAFRFCAARTVGRCVCGGDVVIVVCICVLWGGGGWGMR